MMQATPGITDPLPLRGHAGMLLEAHQVVVTASGRTTSPFPAVLVAGKWRGTKGRPGMKGALREVDRWLLSNAAEEAAARGNDLAHQQFEHALSLKKMSQSDKDCAETYLFTLLPCETPQADACPTCTTS